MEPPRLHLRANEPSSAIVLNDIIEKDDAPALLRYVGDKSDRLVKTDAEGKTLLMWLVIGGAKKCIAAIVDKVDIHCVDSAGSNCLHYASSNIEDLDVAKLLLQKGANPFLKNSAGWSCLHHAIHLKAGEFVKQIIDSPYLKAMKDKHELDELFKEGTFTPLHLAAMGPVDILQTVLTITRPYTAVRDELGMSFMHHAVLGIDPVGAIQALSYEFSSCIRMCDRLDRTPLTLASQNGLWGVANMLLSIRGVDPNLGSPVPLLHAYLNKAALSDGHNAQLHFRRLLEAYASPNVRIGNYTLLDLAQALDDQQMVKLLLLFKAEKSPAYTAMKKAEEKRHSWSFMRVFQSSSVKQFTEEDMRNLKHVAVKDNDGTTYLHDFMIHEVNIAQLAKFTRKEHWRLQTLKGDTPFLYCCRKGSLENILWLLDLNIEDMAMAQDKAHNNALHIALENSNLLIFYCLVKRLPQLINGKNLAGQTPLEIALKKGLHTAVDLLLKYGADTKVIDSEGQGVVHLLIDACNSDASEKQFLPLLNRLVLDKALLNQSNRDGNTPLIYSWIKARNLVFHRLVELGADLDVKDSEEKTVLMRTAERGSFPHCRALVVAGADRNAVGRTTPLLAACRAGSLEVVELLFDKTIATRRPKATIADPNIGFFKTIGIASTPLTAAIEKVREKAQSAPVTEEQPEVQIFLRLLREGAKANKSIRFTKDIKATPLFLCVQYNLPLLAKLLFAYKADPNKTARHQKSPLLMACKAGHETMVDELIKGGAEVKSEYLDKKGIDEGIKRILRQALERKRGSSSFRVLSRQPSIDNLKKVFQAKDKNDDSTSNSSHSSAQSTSRRNSGKVLFSPRDLAERINSVKLQSAGANGKSNGHAKKSP